MEKLINKVKILREDKKSIKYLIEFFTKNAKAMELFEKDKVFNELKK